MFIQILIEHYATHVANSGNPDQTEHPAASDLVRTVWKCPKIRMLGFLCVNTSALTS